MRGQTLRRDWRAQSEKPTTIVRASRRFPERLCLRIIHSSRLVFTWERVVSMSLSLASRWL